jgi:hypothetical protein
MTDKEAMVMALEALRMADELCRGHGVDFKEYGLEFDRDIQVKYKDAITAIKEALAQPEQEPVIDQSAAIRIATVLGWTPPRTWVGLTDEEIWTVLQFRGYNTDTIEIARAIEAKLKQKNGFAEEKNT